MGGKNSKLLSFSYLEKFNPQNILIRKGMKAPNSFFKNKTPAQMSWCFERPLKGL